MSAVDVTNGIYYVNSATVPSLFWLDLKAANLTRGAPLLYLDLHDPTVGGNALRYLKTYFGVLARRAHAAATTSPHVCVAEARKARCVLAEVDPESAYQTRGQELHQRPATTTTDPHSQRNRVGRGDGHVQKP